MRHLGLSLVLGLSASTLACGGTPHDSPDSVTFAAPVLLTCGSDASSFIDLGDFGGHKDILACKTQETARVFVNDGAGSFRGAIDVPIAAEELQTADVDGDGKTDLVWLDSNYDIRISFGNGDGTFKPSVAQPDFPFHAECQNYVASFDGYANAVCWTNEQATIYDIASDGSKQVVTKLQVPGYPNIADIDGDGKADFVYAVGSTVAVQLGLGGGAFGAAQVVLVADEQVSSIYPRDIDADGLTDLVVRTGSSSTGHTFFVVKNVAGSLSVVNQFAEVEDVSYDFEDATGDGVMDVVLTQHEQLVIMTGKGDGKFADKPLLITGPWTSASGFRFTDLNGDGKPDLVVGGTTVSVLLRQ